MRDEIVVDIGQTVHIGFEFEYPVGTAIDPAAIVFKVKPPSGSIQTYTYAGSQITRNGLGDYSMEYTPEAAGDYFVLADTATPALALTMKFSVRRNVF